MSIPKRLEAEILALRGMAAFDRVGGGCDQEQLNSVKTGRISTAKRKGPPVRYCPGFRWSDAVITGRPEDVEYIYTYSPHIDRSGDTWVTNGCDVFSSFELCRDWGAEPVYARRQRTDNRAFTIEWDEVPVDGRGFLGHLCCSNVAYVQVREVTEELNL